MARPVKHGKNWRIRWIDELGLRRSEVYFSRSDALFAQKRHETESDEIRRGLRSPATLSKTFGELADYYLEFYTSQKKRPRDDKIIIGVHLLPFFGELKLEQIANQVEAFKISKSELSKKTVHNHLTLLISMLRVAFDKGWVAQVPKIKKPRIRMFDKDYSYLKTHEEIQQFLRAAGDEGEFHYAIYTTAVYSGLRLGELAGLRWQDVNCEKRLICVQRSYEGKTKNGEVRYVPIVDALLAVLLEWKLKSGGNPLVFSNENGKMLEDSSRIFQEIFKRVLTRAGFSGSEGSRRHYIRFHDLRHTFASHWMMNGGDLFKLQKILGHKTPQMTMRYAHLAPGAFKDDLGRFGGGLAESTGAKVLHLAK